MFQLGQGLHLPHHLLTRQLSGPTEEEEDHLDSLFQPVRLKLSGLLQQRADGLREGDLGCEQSEEIPVGQPDPFDSIIAVVHFVAGFKHNAEAPTAKALHGLKVSQVPGGRHSGKDGGQWPEFREEGI